MSNSRRTTLFSGSTLHALDLAGLREQAWADAFGLAREATKLAGERCLMCGRKMWPRKGTGGHQQLYCDKRCKSRLKSKVGHFKRALQVEDAPCPLCRCEP